MGAAKVNTDTWLFCRKFRSRLMVGFLLHSLLFNKGTNNRRTDASRTVTFYTYILGDILRSHAGYDVIKCCIKVHKRLQIWSRIIQPGLAQGHNSWRGGREHIPKSVCVGFLVQWRSVSRDPITQLVPVLASEAP